MLSVAFIAVVGGAIIGAACGHLLGRDSLLMFGGVGAIGGAFGLMLYALLTATLGWPVLFWNQGIWWSALGVLFALMTLSVVEDPNRRKSSDS